VIHSCKNSGFGNRTFAAILIPIPDPHTAIPRTSGIGATNADHSPTKTRVIPLEIKLLG
jgi:hypothetical protein